jgi:methylated-DNA-[protein]-cysteine S-methyltransferase
MGMTDTLEDRLAQAAAALGGARHDADALAAGADVTYAIEDSPLGRLLLAKSAAGLVRISYLSHFELDATLQDLATRVSPRVLEHPAALDTPRRQLDEYFAGARRSFELPLDWSLAGDFGRRVLDRTARIPYGQVSTYGEVARDIGSPRAARATGNALGANPIPIVVPCHRVVRSGGALGQYAGGAERKAQLLELEAG